MNTLIGVCFLLANLAVLGLNLKLYTEYFKDRSIGRRSSPTNDEAGAR
jgi:hypothetical protein